LRLVLSAIEELVTPGDQRLHFSIRHTSWEHPETAIGMHPLDSLDAKDGHGVLDSARDHVG
jgi:hypothetical protein